MVYVSKDSIDEELVDSIVVPATDPQVGRLLHADTTSAAVAALAAAGGAAVATHRVFPFIFI